MGLLPLYRGNMKKRITYLFLIASFTGLVTSCSCRAIPPIPTPDPGPGPGEKTMVSIAVKRQPNKREYEIGESFNRAGLVIESVFDDASREDLVDGSFNLSIPEGYIFTTADISENYQVTVTYQTFNTSFSLTVKDHETPPGVTLQSIEITHPANTTKYFVGDTIDLAGIEVTAHYSDTSSKVVTGFYASYLPNMNTSGEKTVDISYAEGGITKKTSYRINVYNKVTSLSLILNGFKQQY